eukprot:s115_g21.t1
MQAGRSVGCGDAASVGEFGKECSSDQGGLSAENWGCELHPRCQHARADPDAADDLTGETPLMEAACGGDPELCSLLLDAKADPTRTAAVFSNGDVFLLSAAGKLARDFIPPDDENRPKLLEILAPRLRSDPTTAFPATASASSSRVEQEDVTTEHLEEVKELLFKEAKVQDVSDSKGGEHPENEFEATNGGSLGDLPQTSSPAGSSEKHGSGRTTRGFFRAGFSLPGGQALAEEDVLVGLQGKTDGHPFLHFLRSLQYASSKGGCWPCAQQMNSWAAGAAYDCNFLCICVLGDRTAYSLCKEMSTQMKLTHCVNGFVASPSDMPTYGQLGCQGFIVLDKEHNVISEGTTPFMQVRALAFQHVEALLNAVCNNTPLPSICPGEMGELIDTPAGTEKLKGMRGVCIKVDNRKVDFGFMVQT